jgi:hypothetical protein
MRPSSPASTVLRSGYSVLTSTSLRNVVHLTCMSPSTQNSAPRRGASLNLTGSVRYLRRLQEAAAALKTQQQQPQHPQQAPPQQPTPVTTPTTPFGAVKTAKSPTVTPSAPTTSGLTPPSTSASSGYFDRPISTLLPSEYPIAADTFRFAFDSPNASSSRNPDGLSINTSNIKPPPSSGHSDHPSSAASPHASTQSLNPPTTESYPPTYSAQMTWALPSPSSTNSTLTPPPGTIQRVYPPLTYFVEQRHSLDNLPVPRDQIMEILKLFFLYVYPLTPCIHKPTFMADLQSRREERDPLFFALVLSTVASTLVQVPRSYLPMFDRASVRRLALYCSDSSRLITVAGYDSPNSTQVVIRYLYVLTIFQ